MNCMTRSSLNQLPLICLLLSGEMSQWTTFNKTQPFHYPVSQTSHCHCLSSTSISKREIVTVDSSRGWVRENELWEIVRCFFFCIYSTVIEVFLTLSFVPFRGQSPTLSSPSTHRTFRWTWWLLCNKLDNHKPFYRPKYNGVKMPP